MFAVKFVALASVWIAIAYGVQENQLKSSLVNCATKASETNGAAAMENSFKERNPLKGCEYLFEFAQSLGDARPTFFDCVQSVLEAEPSYLRQPMRISQFFPAPGAEINATAICENMMQKQREYSMQMEREYLARRSSSSSSSSTQSP